MRKWNVLTALLALAFIVTPAMGQDIESLAKKIEALQAQVDTLAVENGELRSNQDDEALEQQINALAERAVASTTVMSKANPVSLTGEFRFRSGWSLGDNREFFSSPTEGSSSNTYEHDGGWTDARVRLGFQYDFTRDVTAYAELQSHWAYGDGAPSSGNYSNLFEGSFSSSSFSNEASTSVVLYQAWLEVRNVFNRAELSSKTGRQEFVKGHQYQFGNADWYNGWVFDGTRWDWDSESFTLTAFAFKLSSADGDLNQVSSYFTSHDDDELYGLYFTLKTIKNHTLDLYWIYVNGHGGAIGSGSGFSVGSLGNPVGDFFGGFGGTTSYFHTVGARIGGVIAEVASGLDWNVEAAYQFGDQKVAGASSDLDVDGFSVEAEVGLTFEKEHMFRVYVRFLWAEGGDINSSGLNDTGYIPLYPNRHSNDGFRARYGTFDLIPMANVLTLQGGLHFNPAQEWTLGATFLWATADEGDLVVSPGTDDDYGIEVDIWGEYRYSENLTFGGGAAILFPDKAGEAIWGTDGDAQLLFYMQARLAF
jgi:hypothetical protein